MTEKVAESPHEEAATADRVAELWAKVLALEAEKPVNDLEITQTLEQLVTPAMRKLTGHPVLLALQSRHAGSQSARIPIVLGTR